MMFLLTVPVIVAKPLFPISRTVPCALLASGLALGAAQLPLFLPLHSIRKFAWLREAEFPPAIAIVMACVPVASIAVIELLVMLIRLLASLGMPAVAPGPAAFELPMEIWIPL